MKFFSQATVGIIIVAINIILYIISMIFAIKLLIQTNDITERNREEDDKIRKNRI